VTGSLLSLIVDVTEANMPGRLLYEASQVLAFSPLMNTLLLILLSKYGRNKYFQFS
jgi:hypothetical protein